MNSKEFIQKYEELLNSGYCDCNELNCLDNNPPRKILNIMKNQQEEIERLNNKVDELMELYTTERHCKDDYKSIIKEAIEYINEMTLTSDGYANYGDDLKPEHIIEILRGSDK